jgi:hypothetical protein
MNNDDIAVTIFVQIDVQFLIGQKLYHCNLSSISVIIMNEVHKENISL